MAVIEKKYTVEPTDVGTANLLTNKGILNLLEKVACFHSEIAGYGINQMNQTHLSWVLLHWKVKVLKRVSYNSTITLKTWSRNANKCLTYRDFEMYDENNTLLAIATSKWALVSTQTGSIMRITPDIIGCYNPEDNKNVFGEIDIPKLKEPDAILSLEPCYYFKVQRRDIDMNYHLHNTYYLDYALEALPDDVFNDLNCNEFEIMYKNGAKLGEQVKCYYVKQNNAHFIIMKNYENDKLHAIIKFI